MGNGAAQVAQAFDAVGQKPVQRIGPEVVAELKARYPGRRLLRLSSKAGEVAALSPNLEEIQASEALADDKTQAGRSMEALVRRCVVYPDEAGLNALLARKPLLVERWCKTLREAAGDDEPVTTKPASDPELALKHQGRELVSLVSASATVTAMVPSMPEMREWRRRINDGSLLGGSADWLVRSCIVKPEREGLNALLDQKPLLRRQWFKALLAVGGSEEEVEVGEL